MRVLSQVQAAETGFLRRAHSHKLCDKQQQTAQLLNSWSPECRGTSPNASGEISATMPRSRDKNAPKKIGSEASSVGHTHWQQRRPLPKNRFCGYISITELVALWCGANNHHRLVLTVRYFESSWEYRSLDSSQRKCRVENVWMNWF